MPVWPHPDELLIDRVAKLHQASYDATVPNAAVAPATWNLVGEHTDQVGGIVINATASYHVAVAASPRSDDTIMVTTHERDIDGEEVTFTDSVTLSEIAQHHQDSQLQKGGPEVRLGGVVWSMINRQYLSRETKGFNITVVSEIPARVGLGDEVATEVAFATILAGLGDHKFDAPLRARLADLCATSAQSFSAVPSFRARYTAALRGAPDKFNVVDYADGSVTHAPLLRDSEAYDSFLVAMPQHDGELADIARREKFIDEAAAAFGVDNLRRLPDATDRVTQWLAALHKAGEADLQPGLDEAHRWLTFFDKEIERVCATAMLLRARKATEALALVRDSQRDLDSVYQVVPEKERQLAELCLARGASAARSSTAGLAHAVVVHAAAKKAANLMADLAEDGFTVVPLSIR